MHALFLLLIGTAQMGTSTATSSGNSVPTAGGVMHKATDRSGACAMAALWTETLARRMGMRYIGEYENMSSPGTLYDSKTHLKGGAERALLEMLGLPPSIQTLPENVVHVGYWKDFLQQAPQKHREDPSANFLISGAVAFDVPDRAIPLELRKEWRRRASFPEPTLWSADAKLRIAVHVRRGDLLFQPHTMRDRLLPNQYYLKLLELIREEEPAAEAIVFGDKTGIGLRTGKWASKITGYRAKDWKGLERTQFRVDGALEEAWAHMIKADVLIMSKSSFSYVPALLSAGVVVFAPGPRIIGYGKPLKHWVQTDAPEEWPGDQTKEELEATVSEALGPAVVATLRKKIRKKVASLEKKRQARDTAEL